MRSIPLLAILLVATSARAADPVTPAQVEAAVDRGLAFLVKDALSWKKEHNCVSCHHAAQVVWSMREAKQHGWKVDEPVLADLTKWLAEAGAGKVGLPRPEGRPRAFNSKAVYFALGLGAAAEPDEASRKAMELMRQTIRDDQIDDGSWVAWPETRPPYFGPSDETTSALATLALMMAGPNDDAAKAAAAKGVKWLSETKTDDDPQSVAVRLMIWTQAGRPQEEVDALVRRIRERQNDDGGWSQAKEMASDAWATGQALSALASAGAKSDDPAIARAHAFLVRTQRDDGSWPMTSRPTKPGDKGANSLIPITGGGSAWGVLGLVRTLPPR